jgi:uncharacterized protein (TIGR02271 family)
MHTMQDARALEGRELHGDGGEKIGTIDAVYVDQASGEPTWIAVRTGLFGTRSSFVPMADARIDRDDVTVPYAKDQVKDAPNVEAGGTLDPHEERRLYQHYRMAWGEFDQARDGGRSNGGRADDDAMTRSEEELRVGTASHESGRARLRKYVVTEEVQTTVPVRHEEVHVEREPITEDNADEAMSGADIAEGEHEVTLHAEEPVVEKRAVPKERVRLEKDTITEERQVSDEVRKERIEAEGDVSDGRRH